MARYIDADALRDRLQSLAYDDWNQGVSTTWANAYSEVADMIDDFPSADVREVKRGRWIRHDDLPYSECPFCNARWSHITENFKFCFACGADLREDA